MNEPAQPPPVGKPLRYLSVCSGMEAASVAWHPLGWTPVGFSEIEPFPCAILKHRFPNVPNYGSLTEYKSWPLEPGAIDLLVGGCPCQSFSVAGLRRGMEDPRGNLTLTFLGLADKLKPRWIVFENVPGLLSSNGGKDFGSFLGALVELGYGFAYRVLDAQHFGVPQRRRRVFVVACLGDWRAAAEVLLESDCVRRDPKKGRAKGQSVAAGAEGGVGADVAEPLAFSAKDHGGDAAIGISPTLRSQNSVEGNQNSSWSIAITQPNPEGCWWDGGPHPTLNQSAKGSGGVGASNQELFSQGGAYLVPGQPITQSDIAGPLDAHYYKGPGSRQGGEREYVAHPIPFRKSKRACSTTDNETWVPADASNTLNNFDLGDTRTTHAVVEPFAWTQNQREEVRILGDKTGALAAFPGTHQSNYIAEPQIYENHAQDSRVSGPLEVAPTVAAKFGTGGGNVPLVTQEPHIVQASELRLRGQITEQDTVPTLLANTKSGDNDPLAVHPVCSDIAGTLTVGHHSCAGHQHRMGDHSFLVGQPVAFQPGNLARRAGSDPSTETFPTLTKNSGDQSPHVAVTQHGENTAGFKWHQGAQAGSIGYEEGVCPTITSVKEPAVIHPVVPLDGMNLLSRLGPCGEEHSIQNFTPGDPSFTLKKGGSQHGVLTSMAVRRLTPVECERLQGFPDNWSRISWKGKPEEQCPDGPRYKACGNSMAVPVMRWIGERIAAVDATLPPQCPTPPTAPTNP